MSLSPLDVTISLLSLLFISSCSKQALKKKKKLFSCLSFLLVLDFILIDHYLVVCACYFLIILWIVLFLAALCLGCCAGFPLGAVSCGSSPLVCTGFLWRLLLLQSTALRCSSLAPAPISVVVVHGSLAPQRLGSSWIRD